MTAAPVGVDRVVERKRIAGDVIDDRSRLDLDELDAAERGSVESAATELEELVGAHLWSIANVCSIV